MALVPAFLRASGAFFLKRNLKEEIAPLYKAMLYDYIQRLLIDDCYVEFFIEGTRSRNFKMQ
jgi:glycerol-3-phosphate O-acyltransferase